MKYIFCTFRAWINVYDQFIVQLRTWKFQWRSKYPRYIINANKITCTCFLSHFMSCQIYNWDFLDIYFNDVITSTTFYWLITNVLSGLKCSQTSRESNVPLGFVSMYVEDVHILRIYDLVLSDLSTFFARHPQH